MSLRLALPQLFLSLLFLNFVQAQTIASSNFINKDLADLNIRALQFLKKNDAFNFQKLFSSETLQNFTMPGVSPLCIAHLTEAVEEFGNHTWHLEMIDSWGKIPEGILVGHWASIGDFDECLALRGSSTNEVNHTTNFKGRYCPMHFLLEGVDTAFPIQTIARNSLKNNNDEDEPLYSSYVETAFFLSYPTWGACLPSTCSRDDFNILFSPLTELSEGLITPLTGFCYTEDKPDLDTSVIAMIGVLCVILLLALSGSIIDIMLRYYRTKNSGSGNSSPTLNFGTKLLLAFSLPTNIEKLTSTASSEGDLGCIHGLRFLSMCWVVLGHTFAVLMFGPVWNPLTLFKEIYKPWTMLAIIHGTFSVDSFFTIGGFLLAFQLLKLLDKSGGKFNPLMMLIHRFLRITPTYAIMIGIVATLPPYFSTGPMWTMVDMGAKFCRRNWWHNLLYINNLVKYENFVEEPTDSMCFGESWYLAVDMQLFLVTPTLVFLVWKWRNVGLGLLSLVTVGAVLTPGVITSEKNFVPTNLLNRDAGTYQVDVYIKPWTRAGSHLAGIWAGYLLYVVRKKSFKLPRHSAKLGWLISTGAAMSVLFGIADWFDPAVEIPRVTGIVYAALHRFVWGVVIGWIIFSCVTGHGGLVNRFLSMKIFMPLGRMTFCVYLASYELQTLFHARFRHPISYDPYVLITLFFGHLVLSLLIGFFLTILLESPFVQIEKLIFGRSSKTTKPPPSVARNSLVDSENPNVKEADVTSSSASTTNLIQ